MMLGVSGLMGSSGDGAAAAAAEQPHESGGGASGGSSDAGAIPGGMDEISERSGGGGGNRWPRQETLALLKIRSEMDVAFRDSSLKGPLWEQVSRKMAELGFQRNAKKCKEKFENVYKYHKRTKDGRTSKPDGKSYRFFDQLEALENTSPISFIPPPPPRPQLPTTTTTMAAPPHVTTVSSTSPNPISMVVPPNNQIHSSSFQLQSQPTLISQLPPPPIIASSNPPQTHAYNLSYSTSSSSTSSDEDIQLRRGKKRKMKDFFEKLMKDVIQKQEEMQKKFLDTLEKRDRDRLAREEAWRVQEMARINREHDLLVQERSIAAAKDGAVIAFLQKVTEQQNVQIPITNNIVNAPPPPPPQAPMQVQPPVENPLPQPRKQPTPPPQAQQITLPQAPAPAPALTITPTKTFDVSKRDNGGDNNFTPASSSRWPKAEVEALIKLRTDLELKYLDSGPKGPLWEEISASMGKLGYNRNPKRCKEKWENINKYFKKVKESNKKRPEDSKTCPYFYQLDAIYKEKAKNDVVPPFSLGYPNPVLPIMAQPEQQWPITQQQQNIHENVNSDNEDEDGDDDEDDEGGGYEIVANKQPSTVSNAAE
ncbi:hypothetical protein RD792_012226 [Penstemon davidsonii]|uniref:Myb-like domain-containing protein n=1 Tax=Penstemon davidsonii TaxID=160366 RepID=A0ABR0CXS9_9LAMI|nr:hypothetical protein RD792_012226 [Penstemon davidsonii]